MRSNARYYDPGLGRFISADTVVPGNASGGMDGVAIKPLTVAFHEGGFLGKLNGENQLGLWFTLSDEQKQDLGSPWGPANPQSLNRYSYVLNGPMKYSDPTGHDTRCKDVLGSPLCTGGVVKNESNHRVEVVGDALVRDPVTGEYVKTQMAAMRPSNGGSC